MGKLIIEGNKVYSVDEACMKRKKLTPAQIHEHDCGRPPQERQNKKQKKG